MPLKSAKKNVLSLPGLISEDDYKNHGNAWGLYMSIDVFGCNREILSNENSLRQYNADLCDLLGVKRYGEPQLILFGGNPPDPKIFGWSIAQMIETSLVAGHFIQYPRHAYVDIFSCKYFDPEKAIRFTVDFFEGTSFKYECAIRGDRDSIPVMNAPLKSVTQKHLVEIMRQQ